MGRTPHYTCCPVVGKGPVRLAEVAQGALDRYARFFEREVSWLREGQATLVLRHANGDDLKEGSTHSDSGGLLTCLSDLVPLARGWAERYGAGAEGPLEVVVTLDVEDAPYEPDAIGEHSSPTFARRYLSFPRGLIVAHDDALAERWAAGGFTERDAILGRMRFLEPRKVVEAEVVWTSRAIGDPGAEASLWREVTDRALDGVPDSVAGPIRKSLSGILAEPAETP